MSTLFPQTSALTGLRYAPTRFSLGKCGPGSKRRQSPNGTERNRSGPIGTQSPGKGPEIRSSPVLT